MNILNKIRGNRSRKPDPVSFWNWFVANDERLRNLNANDGALIDELGNQLSAFHPSLTWETGPAEDGGSEFTISADGIKEAFPAVKHLVASAPIIPGWSIVAFRQRKSPGPLEMDGIVLDPDDIWFSAIKKNSKLDLVLYVKGFGPQTARALQGASFILLDVIIGEYDVETLIGGIDWRELPIDPSAKWLRPLRDLPAFVDASGLRV